MVCLKSLLIPVASSLHDPNLTNAVLGSARSVLHELYTNEVGEVIVSEDRVSKVPVDYDAYIVLVLTGGTEHLILRLAKQGLPIALIAHKYGNSLAAALEAIARLRYDGYISELFLLREGLREDLRAFLKAAHVYRLLLKGVNVVLVGDPSPWLVYSSLALSKSIGNIKFIKVAISEVINELKNVKEGDVKDLLKGFSGIERVEPSEKDLVSALKLYLAIKRLLRRYSSNILTIRCFDLLRYGVTACLPLSLLNDEGLTAGCEGDIPATITMYILSKLSGVPAFMGNIDWVEGNKVLIAHCTIATKLVRKYVLRTHFESGISVGVEGYPRRNSIVTLARLDPVQRVIRVMLGNVVNDTPIWRDKVCRTQFLIEVKGNPEHILRESIGNHYVLTYGDLRRELMYLAKMLNLKFAEV